MQYGRVVDVFLDENIWKIRFQILNNNFTSFRDSSNSFLPIAIPYNLEFQSVPIIDDIIEIYSAPGNNLTINTAQPIPEYYYGKKLGVWKNLNNNRVPYNNTGIENNKTKIDNKKLKQSSMGFTNG